jgi:hypothetical protein
MTEDEAKTKWCPQVRFVEVGGETFNNLPEGKNGTCCIASACMAWRPVYTSVVVTETGVIAPDQTSRSVGYHRRDVVSGGYCGLAGAPR